jgi:hypothetical protein
MNLFELVAVAVLVSLLVLTSRGLAQLFGLPAALTLILIVGIMAVLLRVITKVSSRNVFKLSIFFLAIAFLSMEVARPRGSDLLGLVLAAPSATVIVVLAIGAWKRISSRTTRGTEE